MGLFTFLMHFYSRSVYLVSDVNFCQDTDYKASKGAKEVIDKKMLLFKIQSFKMFDAFVLCRPMKPGSSEFIFSKAG